MFSDVLEVQGTKKKINKKDFKKMKIIRTKYSCI